MWGKENLEGKIGIGMGNLPCPAKNGSNGEGRIERHKGCRLVKTRLLSARKLLSLENADASATAYLNAITSGLCQ
jgi:hypothetical protein